MRAWLLYGLIVIAALAALLAIASSLPTASSTAFFIGTLLNQEAQRPERCRPAYVY